MDIQRLKDIADEVEPKLPTHLDIGGHKVCAEIRTLKAQFREVLGILIEDEEAAMKLRAGE